MRLVIVAEGNILGRIREIVRTMEQYKINELLEVSTPGQLFLTDNSVLYTDISNEGVVEHIFGNRSVYTTIVAFENTKSNRYDSCFQVTKATSDVEIAAEIGRMCAVSRTFERVITDIYSGTMNLLLDSEISFLGTKTGKTYEILNTDGNYCGYITVTNGGRVEICVWKDEEFLRFSNETPFSRHNHAMYTMLYNAVKETSDVALMP